MDKVLVNKELAQAIETVKYDCDFDNNKILSLHCDKEHIWKRENTRALNKLSKYGLAEILVKGYEIEITPEEKTLNLYLMSDSNEQSLIKAVLHFNNIKVVGINA